MSDENELTAKIGELTKKTEDLTKQMSDAATTGEGFAEIKEQLGKAQADLGPLVEKAAKEQREADAAAAIKGLEEMQKQLAGVRTPSKASLIGNPSAKANNVDEFAHFMATVAFANSAKLAGGYQAAMDAKASLDEMGTGWADVPVASRGSAKATVGDTDGAGGYLVPNAVVADINMQATPQRSVVDLFDVVNGIVGSSVDIPWEQEGINRATIAAAGTLKENSNFIVNNYTATLFTLARIFDVSDQLLRQSQGAAERLVRSKLARAFALGEDWYALNGTGTTMPYGLLTALGTSGTYVSTFSSPSDSTVAGSIISAVLTAAGDLAQRGAIPDGVVLNSANFYQMARQGADAAGFWRDPFMAIAAAGQDVAGPGGLRWRHSPNMPSDSLVVGEFNSTQFFRGEGYRVDTSSEAGVRWDYNLTGFRGEEEIAFDARPAVFTGKFQRIVNAIA